MALSREEAEKLQSNTVGSNKFDTDYAKTKLTSAVSNIQRAMTGYEYFSELTSSIEEAVKAGESLSDLPLPILSITIARNGEAVRLETDLKKADDKVIQHVIFSLNHHYSQLRTEAAQSLVATATTIAEGIQGVSDGTQG